MVLLLECVSLNHVRCLSHDIRHLLLLVEIILIVPSPFLDQIVDGKLNAPTGFFVDFVDDGDDFFLLRAGDDAFACMMDGAEGYTCNATGGMSDLCS